MAADFSKIGKSNVNRSKSHERNVAKWLTEWAGVEFRRRRVTGRDTATRMVEATADVIPVQGDFLFSIEAKCGKGFTFDSMFAGLDTCKLTAWWHQTCYDAQFASVDRGRTIYPMLFFKPAIQSNWVAFSAAAVPALRPKVQGAGTLDFPHVKFDGYSRAGEIAGDVSHTKKPKIVKILLDDVIFCRWKDFADHIDPASAISNVQLQQQPRSADPGPPVGGLGADNADSSAAAG